MVYLVEETPQNIPPAILIGIPIRWQMLGGFWYHQISNVRLLQNETHAEINVLARQRNNNFVGEGGGRIEHFRKAKRMRAFHVNADIEKQIFSTNYKKHV